MRLKAFEPINPEEIERVFTKYVWKVYLTSFNGMAQAEMMPVKGGEKVIIGIKREDSKKEQRISLTHELLHIYYEGVCGAFPTIYPTLWQMWENLIDFKAIEFYHRNGDLVDRLYEEKLDPNFLNAR